MPIYVAVGVNIPTQSGVYDYHLPDELVGVIQPGHLVEVPFGSQVAQGLVLEFIAQPSVPETKAVLSLVDADVLVTPALIELARCISRASLAPLADCMQLILPPGLAQQTDTRYTLQPGKSLERTGHIGRRLVDLLSQRGPLRGRQIDQAVPRLEWRKTAQALARAGILSTQSVLPKPSVRPKLARTVSLACSPQEARLFIESPPGRAGAAHTRRVKILEFLLGEPAGVEASWLYAQSGGSAADLQALVKLGLIQFYEARTWRDPLADLVYTPSRPLSLTHDQAVVWQQIHIGLLAAAQGPAPAPYLLHGVTGSGKTEIYLHAIAETLRLGRQAIVLVPEIAMTPQTISRLVARFQGQVGVLHSGLSTGERYDTWQRARLGELSVIAGPRSALFTPFTRLGLIVVDECHDDSYYQSDHSPAYSARAAAVQYANLAQAVCLLGSATPDLDSRYKAERREWHYLSLPGRILAHRLAVRKQMQRLSKDSAAAPLPSRYQPFDQEAEMTALPPVHIVDLRQELKAGNRSIFSRLLHNALAETLQRGQQAILYMNRRGAATFVFCRDCGFTLKCPNCDIPLTYHLKAAAQPALHCHHCAYSRQMPARCPNCRSEQIRHLGTGTERVEAELQAAFPEVRTLRWDQDTTRQKGAHELILTHFSNHQADVLVGTQMIAKGLDLPLVTLVGVILADAGLNLPDLRAAERTFQLLTQVAGRAGRSPLGGQVILQTFQPEHYVIQAAAQHDYDSFFAQELQRRKELDYPPFTNLVRLEYRHRDLIKARQTAVELAQSLSGWIETEQRSQTSLIGPAPCFLERLAGMYRWQIILRGPDPASLLRAHPISREWKIEVNPPSLL